MANPFAGEVAVSIDGTNYVAKLTLGALAELEATLETGSLMQLIERIEQHQFSARDVMAIVVAGLRGGGWQGAAADLTRAEFGGGPMGAAKTAALLLARAFSLPEE